MFNLTCKQIDNKSWEVDLACCLKSKLKIHKFSEMTYNKM